MLKSSSLRSPLKRARGLGSAHTGTHHFWVQRASALALVPLTIWFVTNLISHLIGADRNAISLWLGEPLQALALAALLVALFVHARMGVQVIIEDYVAHEGKKVIAILLLNTLIFGFGAAALMAITRLHFFGI